MGRTLVIGDIHGAARALQQVLDRSGFDPEADRLISLGDLVDGWPESRQCVEMLMEIPHLIAVKGNHDIWVHHWLETGSVPLEWLMNDGQSTLNSYQDISEDDRATHLAFFRRQRLYHLDQQQRLYVHAGFDPDKPLHGQGEKELCWSRSLWKALAEAHLLRAPLPHVPYAQVYIGHTPVQFGFPDATGPVRIANLTNMDLGAKKGHFLCAMDVRSGEFWCSDRIIDLY